LAAGRSGKKDDRGERRHAETEVNNWRETKHVHMQEREHKGSNIWEEQQHICMGGIPNIGRVRVFVIHCKQLKSSIYINRYVGIIEGSIFCCIRLVLD
jgi:hypothetical protein